MANENGEFIYLIQYTLCDGKIRTLYTARTHFAEQLHAAFVKANSEPDFWSVTKVERLEQPAPAKVAVKA